MPFATLSFQMHSVSLSNWGFSHAESYRHPATCARTHTHSRTCTNFSRSETDPDWKPIWSQIFTAECSCLAACQKPSCCKCFTHLGVQLVELMRWGALHSISVLVITGLKKHIHHLPHGLAFQVKKPSHCVKRWTNDAHMHVCLCADGSAASAGWGGVGWGEAKESWARLSKGRQFNIGDTVYVLCKNNNGG